MELEQMILTISNESSPCGLASVRLKRIKCHFFISFSHVEHFALKGVNENELNLDAAVWLTSVVGVV